jgi:hypothetical protein
MLISVTNLKSGKEGGYAVMNQPFQIVKIPVAEKEIIFEYDLDENPLTDLSWLKTKVDEITSLFQGKPVHIAIYQCLYDGGKTGFLEDRGNIAFLYNCEGETLCIKGGDAGETCSELNIVSKVLLWEINNNNGITACGVIDPKKNIPWLAELIAKAETDKTGNYLGVIWLERYKDQDVFVTNMALGSGGLAYHVFDCEGNPATIDNADVQDFFNNLKKDIVIYVNPGDHPLN